MSELMQEDDPKEHQDEEERHEGGLRGRDQEGEDQRKEIVDADLNVEDPADRKGVTHGVESRRGKKRRKIDSLAPK